MAINQQDASTAWDQHQNSWTNLSFEVTRDKAGNGTDLRPGEEADVSSPTTDEHTPPAIQHSVPIMSNGTITTIGSGLFAPFIESRLGNMVPECTPKTGVELQQMVEGTLCSVVTLLPGVTYVLSEFIRVSRQITVIGRPLDMPTVDAHRAFRAFTVEAGGFIDIRFVRLFRGKPIRLRPSLLEIRGGVFYIRRGGRAVLTSCFLTVNPRLITEFFISEQLDTLRLRGGYILQEEGTLVMTDVHIYVTRPGVLFREVYTVGGQVLLLAGNAVFTGCTFLSNLLFVNVVGVGDAIGVFGGTAIFTGCSFTLNCAFLSSQGTGMLLFMGGGVSVLTGCQAILNIGARTFFGAGGTFFSGGGVSIWTGVSVHADIALLFGAAVGVILGQGAGIFIKTGVSQTGYIAVNAVACLGLTLYVGSGVVVQSETLWVRVAAVTAFYGGGGSVYIHAGTALMAWPVTERLCQALVTLLSCTQMPYMTFSTQMAVSIINTAGLIINIILFASIAGGHFFLHAGWLTTVNMYFYKFECVGVVYGQGTEILVLAGGAALINTGYQGGVYFVFHGNRRLAQFWIAGHDVVLRSNKTFSGAIATRDKVTYILKDRTRMRVQMQNVAFEDYDQTEVERVFGFRNHRRHLTSLQEKLEAFAVFDPPTQEDEEGLSLTPTVKATPTPSTLSLMAEAPVLEQAYQRVVPFTHLYIPTIPTDVRTDHIFLAGGLDDCSLCNVKPGHTSENVDGPGAATCALADRCENRAPSRRDALDENSSSSSSKSSNNNSNKRDGSSSKDDWWNPPPDLGMPNSSVAVLDIQVKYTPTYPFTAYLEPDSVEVGIKKAFLTLGVTPRAHVRVQPDLVNPLNFDDEEYVKAVRRDTEQNGGLNAAEVGTTLRDEEGELLEEFLRAGDRKMVYEECLSRSFRVYVVSDWQNVTDTHIDKLKGEAGSGALTLALQDTQPADDGVKICEAFLKTARSIFIPGLKASSSKKEALEKGKSSIADVLGAGKATSMAAAALTDSVTGARVDEVWMGKTYALEIENFAPATPLVVKLVPRDGDGPLTLDAFFLRDGEGGLTAWMWTVDETVEPGAYFLQVTSEETSSRSSTIFEKLSTLVGLKSATPTTASNFAYTQAFDVRE